jgi:uncharacterized protein YecE (DUF72 family)
MIRIGPAGWSYTDWNGIVYPAPKPRGFDPLAYLARYFDTIEINSTYYRPATREAAKAWAERVGDNPDFKFAVKLWKRFTHERDEAWTRSELALVRQALDALRRRGRLGAVLAQFPWSFRRTDENRQWLDDVTRALRAYPLVVEVRHESWDVPEYFDELADRGVGFVNIDQPLFKRSIKPSARATAPVGYVRVHGRNYREWFRKDAGVEARYDYLYSKKELAPWAERAVEVDNAANETYVVTNNHFKGKAVANALMLEAMVRGEKVPAPTTVVDEYRGPLRGLVRRDES